MLSAMSSAPTEVSPSSPLGKLLGRVRELIEEGRYADAIGPLTEAAALRPDSPNIQTDLGGLYIEADRPGEALEPLKRAIAINPRIAVAHWRLGTALQALGDMEGAIHALERAVQIRPGLPDAHYRLGLIYGELGRRRDALESYRQAAQWTTEPAEKQFLEAQALVAEGRETEAEALLRSALELDPDLPTVHGLLGQILASAGRFGESAKHVEAQLARSPRAGVGYYDLVRSRKITETDLPLLDRIDSALADETQSDLNRMLLLLARGKALDDLGQYEHAMKSLDEASALRSRAFSIRVEDFENQVDAIIGLFGTEIMRRCVSANPERTPVLILGMPRSGTTLVEQIVSTHPEVSGSGELAFWRNRLPAVLDAKAAGLTADFLESTADAYLRDLRIISSTATRVTDKDPFNFLAIGLIYLVFPHAAIIHCRRNPLDTAISIHQTHFSKSTGMPTGGEELVRYFRAYERLMDHWRRVLPQGRLFEVNYERLVSWPQAEIRNVIAHIGLDWDPACLAPHVNTRLVRTPSGFQVRQRINTGSIDRWRNYEPWLGPLAALREEAAVEKTS
jgi:tetratricopeptide (TPR) repeat protein